MQETDSPRQRRMNPETIDSEGTGVIIIRSLEEIEALENPEEVKIAHLSGQKAVKIKTIKELSDACPNLMAVSVPPRTAQKTLSLEAKEFLAENDIKLQIKRRRDLPYYDCLSFTTRRNYLKKKGIYEEVFWNPDKEDEHRTLFLLNKYGFRVTEIAKMYFGEKAMAIGKIAEEKGLKYFDVYKDITTLLHLIGYPSLDPNILARSREWLRKLEKTAEDEAWLRLYQVDLVQPPETLYRSRWKMWHKIMQFRTNRPDKWSHIKEKHRRHHEILVKFFQLDEFRGKITTLEQIAKKFDITVQGVSLLKKTALKNLGLL